jgi:DnaJ like chaperone protein
MSPEYPVFNKLSYIHLLIGCFAFVLFSAFSYSADSFADSDTSGKTEYYFMDEAGKLHPAENLEGIPKQYKNRIKVVRKERPGERAQSVTDWLLDFFKSNASLISTTVFWLIVLIVALLHATGKLEQGYYHWVEYMKQKQGIDGLYRERHSQTHDRYLELIFCLAGKLSRADGSVQRAELDALEEFILTRLQLGEQDSQRAKQFFRKGRDSKRSFESFCSEFGEIFRNRKELLRLAYSFLELIADADGAISKEEEALLLIARNILGVKESYYTDTAHPSAFTPDEAYEILECSPYDDFATVKRKYRKLVVQLHPDKLNAQGMSAEFIQLAKEQFLKVQAAYEQIEAQQQRSSL